MALENSPNDVARLGSLGLAGVATRVAMRIVDVGQASCFAFPESHELGTTKAVGSSQAIGPRL